MDNFFDLIESVGYPPRVQTPTLDQWHDFSRQLHEDLTRRVINGDRPACTRLGYGIPPDQRTPMPPALCIYGIRRYGLTDLTWSNGAGTTSSHSPSTNHWCSLAPSIRTNNANLKPICKKYTSCP
jgi:hypothetical protein